MARRFAENVPQDLALKLRNHMKQCGYSQGTIEMRISNLGYVMDFFGTDVVLEHLNGNKEHAQTYAENIDENLPTGGVRSADVQAFKLAWESTHHGQELFKKRVKSVTSNQI
jgi:hypothetical protein